MKVRVTQASEIMWYAPRIGEVFNADIVAGCTLDDYKIVGADVEKLLVYEKDPSIIGYYIKKSDCEVISKI